MATTLRLGLASCGVLLVTACGLNMEKNYRKMRPNLVAHNYEAASEYLDSIKKDFYSKDNRLLYYMDKGMVLHLGKRYQESNAFLEKAKTTAEELWTESVSAHAAAWLTTDNSLPYQGEDFEKVLLHFVSALNYIGMGDYAGARVEARQITNKLELYNSKYEGEESQNQYRDDAFARWLSGKMAETEGGQAAFNDAWIDYRKAIQIYEKDYAQRYGTSIPKIVIQDALRVLDGLGGDFKEEFDELRARFPDVPFKTAAEAKGLSEVVLLHLAGEAPYKIDKFWDAQAGDELIRIAFPEFVPKRFRVRGARLSAGGVLADSEVTEDITAIAIQNLNDHMARIKVKAIARAVAKYLAGKGAEAAGKEVGGNAGAALQIAGALWNMGSAIAEEADKRSWITLPGAVTVTRMWIPPGDVTVKADFLAHNGAVVEGREFPVSAKPGKAVFLTHRTYR